MKISRLSIAGILAAISLSSFAEESPYKVAVKTVSENLVSQDASLRMSGLERIGLMRAFELSDQAIEKLSDSDATVRREAAMVLGLVGNRAALEPLKKALNDSDWTVRQSAANSLFNLTSLDVKFDALANEETRATQAAGFEPAFEKGFDAKLISDFKAAVKKLPKLEERQINLAQCRYAETSSTNIKAKKFAEAITCGGSNPWQPLKNDKNPWFVVDLGGVRSFEQIDMGTAGTTAKNIKVLISDDGENYTEVANYPKLTKGINIKKPMSGRYIKVTAEGLASFKGLAVWNKTPSKKLQPEFREEYYAAEKAVRAIERLDVEEALPLLIEAVEPYEQIILTYLKDNDQFWSAETLAIINRAERGYAQALIRAIGRFGGEDARVALQNLVARNNSWACYAAQALGDCGNEESAIFLINQFWQYGVWLERCGTLGTGNGDAIRSIPDGDRARLAAYDRVPRTWHDILSALCRIDIWTPEVVKVLRENSPYLISTVPNIWDGTVSWQKEAHQQMTGYLLEKAGVRKEAMNAALESLKVPGRKVSADFEHRDIFLKLAGQNLTPDTVGRGPYAGPLMICAAEESDIPTLISLQNSPLGWIRIDSSRALLYLNAQEAIAPTIKLLEEAKDDLDYGVDGDYRRLSAVYTRKYNLPYDKTEKLKGNGYDEINDPSPRFKDAWIRMLGGLKAKEAVPVLIKYLNNERNAMEIAYAAANALAEIGTPEALEALRKADVDHPVSTVRTVAREALWANDIAQLPRNIVEKKETLVQLPVPEGMPKEIVFIKGDMIPVNSEQISQDMSSYSTTDAGPTIRLGRNIFRLKTEDPEGSLQQLTNFKDGWVADLEVSYDGKRIMFSRRGEAGVDPFWHIYEMNADGSDLRQITDGPYLDVHPNYMPDGRIVFTTSRTAIRDEYHGYPANGLAVMNRDGSDIHIIGLNMGRDNEPIIGEDGKILFTRLELFYSRNKTEHNLISVSPDGTRPVTLYGPERREFHYDIKGAQALSAPRHRILRMTQPQQWDGQEILMNTFKGPMIVEGPTKERMLMKNNDYSIATPYKIDDNTLLCSAGKRPPINKKSGFAKEDKKLDLWAPVDHGLNFLNIETGEFTPIYNDPTTSEFEARPLQPRKIPPIAMESPLTREDAFTGKMFCNSIYNTRQTYVKQRGKYVRVNEGIPTIARHNTHNAGVAWRNHGGAIGRIWGTFPVAADGSFAVELPADRLFHFQVLDADFRVVGNEFIWQYARPSENRSCVGCHEEPGAAPNSTTFPIAHRQAPIKVMPYANDVQYHAKMWFKGWGPDEREERMRTANAINILGRY